MNARLLASSMRMANKKALLARVSQNNKLFVVPVAPKQAVRFFQSPKKAEEAGYIDTLVGVYEDPAYGLDLKPDEWREGQAFHYVAEFGIMIVSVPGIIVATLCASFLAWYTFFDSQTSVFRNNPHPYFAINNGMDLHQTRNPIWCWAWPYGPHSDLKVRFYYEIQDAIERKQKMN